MRKCRAEERKIIQDLRPDGLVPAHGRRWDRLWGFFSQRARRTFANLDDLQAALDWYLTFYNNYRLHSAASSRNQTNFHSGDNCRCSTGSPKDRQEIQGQVSYGVRLK